jgi:UDP-glucose 4-epimerase
MSDGRILVVGGAGYIGSHAVVQSHQMGRSTVVVDDFSTGYREALQPGQELHDGNLADGALIKRACSGRVEAAMHFASFIQVDESVTNPAKYYANNVACTISLLNALCSLGVKYFIFSSSAATYGEPTGSPIPESHPTQPLNPYGRTKLMVEQLLPDYERAYGLRWVALRYFNAAGAHPRGTIGERHEPETHLIPLALRAANGRLAHLTINGTDYPTPDGTCIRDYVHVCDLADAHLLALKYLERGGISRPFNLGNGDGFSVKQVVESVERVTGRILPVRIGPRRAGDPAVLVADAALAKSALGWKPQYAHLDTIVTHAWAWERKLV